jgi:hypothetical protein
MSPDPHLRFTIAAVILLLGASPASTFEVNGYRAGTPMAEVQQRIADIGWRWELASEIGLYQSATAVSPGRSGMETRLGFGFCRGELSDYTTGVGEDPSDFVRLVEQETARLGEARYQATTSETQFGPSRVLSFIWQEQNWEMSLAMLLFRGEPSVTQSWTVGCP